MKFDIASRPRTVLLKDIPIGDFFRYPDNPDVFQKLNFMEMKGHGYISQVSTGVFKAMRCGATAVYPLTDVTLSAKEV